MGKQTRREQENKGGEQVAAGGRCSHVIRESVYGAPSGQWRNCMSLTL